MGYKIEQKGDKFELLEGVGEKPLKLGTYDTLPEAEHSKKQWQARDEVEEKAQDFIDELIQEYCPLLDDDEVKLIVKDAAKGC
jgi:hypothetical protein